MKNILIIIILSILFFGCVNTAIVPEDTTIQTVTNGHAHIHKGKFYTASNSYVLNNGQKRYITLHSGNVTPHLNFIFRGEFDGRLSFYEGAIVNTTGTVIDYYNRNRNYLDTNSMILYSNSTYLSLGNKIFEKYIGIKKESDSYTTRDEWLLNNNTIYVIEIESYVNSSRISYELNWYE